MEFLCLFSESNSLKSAGCSSTLNIFDISSTRLVAAGFLVMGRMMEVATLVFQLDSSEGDIFPPFNVEFKSSTSTPLQ